MHKKLPLLYIKLLFVLHLFICSFSALAQTTVFNDDFSTSAGTAYTTATGAIGTSAAWNFSRSGSDFGARINTGNLTLTNDAGGTANNSGWTLAYTGTSSFTTPYNPILGSNPGALTWSFNMRQIRTNPRGFSSGYYGAAFILAGTAGTTNVSGTGYAIVLGNSGTTDPIKLVRYSAGIRTFTTMISSSTTGLTDFGNQYLSIKVTYTPSNNTWQLFVRNDGTAFIDPSTGTLTPQGTFTNSTYTTSALQIMGGYWNGGTSTAQTAIFDNVKVTVAVPVITSISPSSRTAGTAGFPLTVNGSNFVTGTSTVRWNGSNRSTTYVSPTQLTAVITAADISASGTASITVANGTAISNAQTFTIDPAGVPALTVSTNAVAAMNTITGTASSSQAYTISGANLTADPVVTAPANFELSTNNTTFTNTLTLPRTGNVLTGQPVNIYSRLKSTAPAGIYSGSIDHSVTGAVSKAVSVSGTVLATQPATQATAITFTGVTSTSFTINWSNGNGASRMVLVRSGSAVTTAPVDGIIYNGSTSFGAGAEAGSGNYTVYTGTGNNVAVTGLTPTTAYHVAVYEYNGSGGTENYLSTSPAIGNRTTLNAPVGWQIYSANTTNTITFDSTVDGVNADIFQADGISPNSESGELNSNAWAIAGLSDGNIGFGGSYSEDGDHDRGPSTGGETDGGVYAFETSTDNVSLGLQPATGDFAPGSVTLRFQNQSGAAITSISLGYKVYVYNDQAASSSFNFSHSADNSAYVPVAGMNVVSPATADINPAWKSYYRVVTITGLNVANNNYYYVRWSGATVSGSVSFDEFGLDDIVLVANPSTTFASFNGTADNFVVNGNTSLSGDLTVANDITFNSGKADINGKTLTLSGSVTNNISGGLKGGATSNLIINGTVSPSLSFDPTTPGTTNLLNNFSVSPVAGNTVTLLTPVAVNGTLLVSINRTLNLAANTLTGTLASIVNNGTINTQNTTALPLSAGKIWGGTGIVNYNAASAVQTVVTGTYNNLTVSTAGGAVAAGSFTVNGTLHLPAANPSATVGSLSMGTYTLTMGGSSTNTGTGDVTGIITRNSIVNNVLYTFGNTHTSIIFPVAGTLPTSMSLKVVIGTAPTWRPGAIKRTYDFIQSGASSTKAVIKAHYLDSELNGNLETKLVDWAYIVSSNTTLEQGRSNYNTTENWTELTNVNVGLYFAPVFDAVRLTLDESEAGSLTWNGSVSNSWTTAANWTPNATPSDQTIVYIPDAATTPNDPVLNPSVLLGALNIEPGGILLPGSNTQFTINGGAGAWINNGAFTPGSSTVTFTNADATIAGTTNFNNITINSGATLRPITGNVMTISGTFINNGTLFSGLIDNTVIYNGSGQTIASTNSLLGGYHNLIINGIGSVFPVTINITGNLTLNQAVDFTGKTIAFTGVEMQSVSGSAAPVFNNLTINNTFGEVQLASSATISGTLTLTAGNLNIGNSNLTLGSNAVAGTFGSGRMIIASGTGEVRRPFTSTGSYTFPIGDNTNVIQYSPITVFVNSGAFSNAYIGVSVIDAVHPNNASTENNISRYWKVNQSGITGAVATITASYLPVDLTGPEADISAAQLNGTFNQQTNPWIRYTGLTGNTLTATAAPLTQGQASYFTGIKGGSFTALISGYGSFCQNEAVTLEAAPSGGTAPYTYSWSGGLGTAQTATPPTTATGSVSYTVTVKDSNGITVTDTASVIVILPSSGGTVSPNQNICLGTVPGNITLTGYNGAILHWQSSADLNFTSPLNISNTTAVLTGVEIGSLTATTWFRAVVQNGSCSEVYSAPAAVFVRSTTWNGSVWSDGVPDMTTTAYITGNFTAAANFNACTLTVSNNAMVVIPSGFDITLNGALTVTSGNVTLENSANLLQLTDAINSGSITVKRNSSALKRQDYTLWSSPVAAQNMLAFSPLTVVSPTSRFYLYNTLTNLFNSVASPSTTNFNVGQGYLIRMPNTHPTTATIWNGQFSGVPNNGNITFTMTDGGAGQRFNVVGNPYPSPIDAVAFVNQNSTNITGALYFWRKTNNALSPSYCSWTANGGFVGNGEDQVYNLNGVIQTGQGFFVEGTGNGNAVNFTNSQRVGDNANQFFRTEEETERHRIWLNVTNDAGAYSQMLVGYISGATLGVDANTDGKYMNDGPLALTTKIDGIDYVIQGRPLPFDASDNVALNLKVTNAGTYSISIDHTDGLFLNGQNIFLKDNLAGGLHNLNQSGYTFTSDAGTFGDRFEIVYLNSLSGGDHESDANAVVVYKQGDHLVVRSQNITIDDVKVFDIRGRLLTALQDVNASEARIPTQQANEVLIVKITLSDGTSVTKKAVN
ncbi:MAG TPA: T9SS sorting signal type C domain-containing protein [Flavobacterium sp.]|jgi:hypothetical protein